MDIIGIGIDPARFLNALLNFSNSPILITDANAPDNPIIFANPAFEHLTGYRPEEVIGRNCRILQNEDWHQPGRATMAKAILAGTSCEVLLRNYRKDGQMFWVRIYMFPVTDDHAKITHYVGIQHDVTTETELVRDLKEKQIFVDTSPDAYLKLTANLTVIQVSGACQRLFGVSPCELIGEHVATIVPGERIAESLAWFRRLGSGDPAESLDLEYSSKSGQRLVIQWNALRKVAGDENLFVCRDVTSMSAGAQRG